MATPSRESVFSALFALSARVTWSNASPDHQIYTDRQFVTRSRRIKLFDAVAPALQPACYQIEHNENIAQTTNLPYKQIWEASWVIYQATGKDPKAVPTIENNLIIDAVFEALRPRPTAGVPWNPQDPKNTLGGLVYHCWIDGDLFKDPGDIDNQGMIVVPFKILVPNN